MEIKNSANKLRSKVQANIVKGYQKRTIDLNESEIKDQQKYKNQSRQMVSSVDRKHTPRSKAFNKNESQDEFKSALSPKTIFSIQNHDYDSKLTFSAEREQEQEINIMKDKLMQTENIQ